MLDGNNLWSEANVGCRDANVLTLLCILPNESIQPS